MTDETIINLRDEIIKRDAPHEDCVVIHGGKKWFKYVASYRIDGTEFTVSFFAWDFQDAERRINRMKEDLQLDGQVYLEGDW